MSKKENDGKILANFRVDPNDWVNFRNMSLQMHGHGSISRLLQSYVKEWLQKNDGKTAKMDNYLDPNFTPKPIAFDDLDKIVTPFAMQLSDADLHRLRIWAFQTHTICTAYSKLSAQRRKVTKMTYEECIEVIRRSENGS